MQYEKSLEQISNLKSQKLKKLNEKKSILRKLLEMNFIEMSSVILQNYPKELKKY